MMSQSSANDYATAVAILKNNHWHKPNPHIWESYNGIRSINESHLQSDPRGALSQAGFDWDTECKSINSAYVPPNTVSAKYFWDESFYKTEPIYKTECEHKWVDYKGLQEAYTFCDKCNKRK